MRPNLRTLWIFALSALLSSPLAAQAGDLVVGNLDQGNTPSNYDTINPFIAGVHPGYTAAQEFTTGATGTSLDKVFASLGNYDPGDGTFALTASLVLDNRTTPTGAVQTTFSFNVASIPGSGLAVVEFDPTSSVSLTANTGYWFVLTANSDDGSGSTDWQWTTSTDHSGPGTLPRFANNFAGTDPNQWNVFPDEPFMIQVNSTVGPVVPEPTSWVLGGIGLAGMLMVTRLTRSRRAA
jgi:hypothetical protein